MTDKRDEYVLRLSGVEIGNHKYSMVCDKAFFELTGLNDIEEGNINVRIEMEKSANILSLQFHFNGEVMSLCDRCLDFLPLSLNFSDFLVVNLVPHIDEFFKNDDNSWQLHEKAYELDLAHFLYEAIKLTLPAHRVHSEDENGNPVCNPEMLKKLAELAPKEEQQHETTETDPRWDTLKQLKF
jgi:uncharacterized metal-binding protein YceD (DUF177 family)